MAYNHAICLTTNMMCWDVDALNLCGIYGSADLDNGVIVTLSSMNVDSNDAINGYEYDVALATSTSTECYVIATPLPGTAIEQQYLSDPRTFYNKAGRPMSIKYLMPKTDCIEVDANAFDATVDWTDFVQGQFVKVGSNGKLDADVVSVAPASGIYFRIEGKHSVSVGQEEVPTVVLRCMAN